MTQLIDGKRISKEIKDELKEKVAELKIEGKEICLAVIQVGNDPASSVYVNNKKKACAYIGIESDAYELPEDTTEEELLELVEKLNRSPKVNGILVQLPLPGHIDEDKVIRTISPDKDGWISSGQRGTVMDRRERVSLLYPCRNHSASETFRNYNRRERVRNHRKKQHCGQADGCTSSQRKCYCYGSPFPYQKSERNYKQGGYPDCCHGKEKIYHC